MYDGGPSPGATFADGPVPQAQPEAELVAPQLSQSHAVDTSRGLQGQEGGQQVQPEVTPKYSVQQLREAFNLAAKEYDDDHDSREKRREYKDALTALLGQVDEQLRASGVDPKKFEMTTTYSDDVADLFGLRNAIIVATENVQIDTDTGEERIQRGLDEQETQRLVNFIRTRLHFLAELSNKLQDRINSGQSSQSDKSLASLRDQCLQAISATRSQVGEMTDHWDIATNLVLSSDTLLTQDLSALTTYVNRDPQTRTQIFHVLLQTGSTIEKALQNAVRQDASNGGRLSGITRMIEYFISSEQLFRDFLRSWTTT